VATPVYPSFETNINRAEALIRIFARGRKRGRPRLEDTQLTRSSLVFSVGALDAYLHDLVLEVVANHVPHSEDLDRTIKEMEPHNMVQTMIRAASHDAAREHFRTRLDEHFDDKSFMDVAGLQRALRLTGCHSTLDVQELPTRTGRATLAEDLGRHTDRRHRIIHRGENVVVKKEMAEDCAVLVRLIVRAVDDEVSATYHGA
jgi:hypothetical protein